MQRPASIRVALTAFGLICVACGNRAPDQQLPSPAATVAGASGGGAGAAAGTSGSAGSAGSAGGAGITMPTPQMDAMPPAIPDGGTPVMPTDGSVRIGEDDDAGPWAPPDPTCTDGQWRMAPGFLLARKVDYVADRAQLVLDGGVLDDKVSTISSAGIPCASATDKKQCQAALDLPVFEIGRHLVTTAGDNVRLWNAPSAGPLLGLIDTKSEAMWWGLTRAGYLFPCNTKVETADGGFTMRGAVSSACGPVPHEDTHRPLNLWISNRGEIIEQGLQDPNGFLCGPPADAGMPDAGLPIAGTSAGAAGMGFGGH